MPVSADWAVHLVIFDHNFRSIAIANRLSRTCTGNARLIVKSRGTPTHLGSNHQIVHFEGLTTTPYSTWKPEPDRSLSRDVALISNVL